MTEMTVYENRRVLLIGRIKEEYAKEREEEGKVGHFFLRGVIILIYVMMGVI
jgi:hypothetical protein